MIIGVVAKRTLVVVDQHAIHERIRYEHFLKTTLGKPAPKFRSIHMKNSNSWMDKNVKVQNPVFENVGDKILTSLIEFKEQLSQIGIEFITRGSDHARLAETIAIGQKVFGLKEIIKGFSLDKDLLNNLELESGLSEKLKQFCCKNAVKFNDVITEDQAEDLMHDLQLCDYPFYCIHGRNTVFPLAEIKLAKANDFNEFLYGQSTGQ